MKNTEGAFSIQTIENKLWNIFFSIHIYLQRVLHENITEWQHRLHKKRRPTTPTAPAASHRSAGAAFRWYINCPFIPFLLTGITIVSPHTDANALWCSIQVRIMHIGIHISTLWEQFQETDSSRSQKLYWTICESTHQNLEEIEATSFVHECGDKQIEKYFGIMCTCYN
jgi:hypothetical protein